MKSLKSVLTAIAFVFAIGAAFAFKPSADTMVSTWKPGGPFNCQTETTCIETSGTQCSGTFYSDSGCSSPVMRYTKP